MPFQKGHNGFIPKHRYAEIGRKISLALKGKKLSPEHKAKLLWLRKPGDIPWNKGLKTGKNIVHDLKILGTKHTKETKEKMRVAQHKRLMAGDNHKWKGGRDRWWRKQALIRDDYTCQICGLRDAEIMQVDHIKPKGVFPLLRWDLENLISLCPNCHVRKHMRDRKHVMSAQLNLL